MASRYMLSYLLSPTSERLAVGSMRWGEEEGQGMNEGDDGREVL